MSGIQKVHYDFPGMLEKLTGRSRSKWKEVDGPESGAGIDYFYRHGNRKAYIHIDQADLNISIGDVDASEADEHYLFNNGSLDESKVSEEIEEFVERKELSQYHVQIDRRISAYSPEHAARKFAAQVDGRGSRDFIIDVFQSDITQGLASDERAGMFDPDSDFELIG